MPIAPAPDQISPSLAELTVPLDSLVLHPRNARQGDLAAITGSLRRFGQLKPIVVQANGRTVVAGNHLVKAALALGWTTIAASVVELSDREAEAYLLADNRTSDLGQYDEALLAQLLADAAGAENLLGTGYSADDVDRILAASAKAGLADPDDLPELTAAPSVERGQLFALGHHRLLIGDATDPADVARLLDGAEPRLLSCDPPYGISLDTSWRDRVARSAGAPARARGAGHRNTTIAGDARVDWSAAFALVPSLQVGYVWHASVHGPEVAQGLVAIGFEIVSQVIWDKGAFAMGRSWFHFAHEPAWVVRKPGIPRLFHGSRDQSTVWRVPSPKMRAGGSKEAKLDHPTQKPVALSEIPLRNHAGDVYDPFVGSGTTIIAAEQLGRRCYAMEIDPRFAQLTIERWQAFTGERAVAL